MDNDTLLSFDLPGVARKKLSLAFDGGRLSLDGGVLLSREAERDLRLAERLAYVCFRADSGPRGVTGWMSGDSQERSFASCRIRKLTFMWLLPLVNTGPLSTFPFDVGSLTLRFNGGAKRRPSVSPCYAARYPP